MIVLTSWRLEDINAVASAWLRRTPLANRRCARKPSCEMVSLSSCSRKHSQSIESLDGVHGVHGASRPLFVSPGAKDGMEQPQALATRQRPVSVNAPLGGRGASCKPRHDRAAGSWSAWSLFLAVLRRLLRLLSEYDLGISRSCR